ncbi:hypothetical protein KY313_02970 [Candidatus Woesearchaeota archaeon]|jgi:hypothetical protein|nr:hypothetical protein [Candidatus Woesearchaeota archaeon]
MGFMDKLKFWKKEEGLDLETSDIGAAEETPNLGLNEPLSLDTDPSKATSEFISPEGSLDSSLATPLTQPEGLPGKHAGSPAITDTGSTEIISSKLDAIKANIENINLRLTKIENHMEDMKNKKSW